MQAVRFVVEVIANIYIIKGLRITYYDGLKGLICRLFTAQKVFDPCKLPVK